MKLILNVTSVCNLSCSQCGQKSWRRKLYHMSEEEVKNIIYYSEKSNYEIKELILSGGEPILWKNIHMLDFIRSSKIVKFITFFTNGVKEIPKEVLKNIDRLIISKYPKSNEDNINKTISNCSGLLKDIRIKNKKEFLIWPDNKLDNCLPAKCYCKFMSYYDGVIASCGEIFEIEKRYNVDLSKFKTTVDHINFLDDIETNHGSFDHCSYCIENKLVQKKIKKVKN